MNKDAALVANKKILWNIKYGMKTHKINKFVLIICWYFCLYFTIGVALQYLEKKSDSSKFWGKNRIYLNICN